MSEHVHGAGRGIHAARQCQEQLVRPLCSGPTRQRASSGNPSVTGPNTVPRAPGEDQPLGTRRDAGAGIVGDALTHLFILTGQFRNQIVARSLHPVEPIRASHESPRRRLEQMIARGQGVRNRSGPVRSVYSSIWASSSGVGGSKRSHAQPSSAGVMGRRRPPLRRCATAGAARESRAAHRTRAGRSAGATGICELSRRAQPPSTTRPQG